MAKAKQVYGEGIRSIKEFSFQLPNSVSVAVKLASGVSDSESEHLSRMCPKCNGQVGNVSRCKSCNSEISFSDMKKCYRYGKGEKDFVEINSDEMNWLKGEAGDTIRSVGFFDENELSPILYDKPYFLFPKEESNLSFIRMIADNLQESKKSILVKFAVRDNNTFGVVSASNGRLLLYALRFSNELKDVSKIPTYDGIVDKKYSDFFKSIMESNTIKFDVSSLKNDREERFGELVRKKIAGESLDIPKPEAIMTTSNPFEQLAASIGKLESK